MAVKITRQTRNIVLLGSATSAAALRPGHERAAAALRAAGLVDRLKTAGFQVADHGDTATSTFQPDEEHPRARNVAAILKSLNDLRPRAEVAIKSGALPVILSGDCISVLAVIAAARRYYRHVSLIFVDRDADLNVPATTHSGCVDGMVISQVIGRGAPELVRFWGEPPLVREPDIALFGFERLDPPEENYLLASPLRRHPALEVSTVGAAAAARLALERVHAANHQFILHFDVDTISSEEFPWTNFPGSGGLSLSEVRDALRVFVSQANLAALVVAGYNPELDADGTGARKLIDLLADVLSSRLETETAPATPAEASDPIAAASASIEPGAPSAEPAPESFATAASSERESRGASAPEPPGTPKSNSEPS
ncbi:MAG TPA: arginase family protein [Candidatus Acidoferrales bacterium]|nr:arginase family protein [Candidatus Acidoferrales bacterium]